MQVYASNVHVLTSAGVPTNAPKAPAVSAIPTFAAYPGGLPSLERMPAISYDSISYIVFVL